MTERIVVGMDGSDFSAEAIRWAVSEADLHGAEVKALLVWSYLEQHRVDPDAPFDPHYGEDDAREVLSSWVSAAVGDAASAVELATSNDLPARGIVEAGDAADLVVVGARGRGGFEGLLLGSVSERVVEQARQPVAVIRTAAAPVRGGRVVVGIDGSTRSQKALAWAAGEARARDADLDVVQAWQVQALAASPWGVAMINLADIEQAAKANMEKALADPALEGVKATGHVVNAGASRALIEQAHDAGLVVAGSRGLGRMGAALLGSVTRQLLHHAPCPVVVV